jgi:thioredoxin-like negative regulator of GroEL
LAEFKIVDHIEDARRRRRRILARLLSRAFRHAHRDLTVLAELAGRPRVAKLNVDENPATAARFGIQSIPALLVFKGGREVDRLAGAQPKAQIARWLERAIA